MDRDEELFESSKNSQVFALSWVKQKAAKLIPDQVKLTEDELKLLIKADKQTDETIEDNNSDKLLNSRNDGIENASNKLQENTHKLEAGNNDGNEDDDLKEFNMDDYDNEEDDAGVDQMSNLVVFSSNKDDPYLTKLQETGKDEESSEDEEVKLLDTDNFMVCACCESDYAEMEIYVYNNTSGDFYIHHDIPLPSPPLCLQWMDFPCGTPMKKSNKGNFIAVGNLDSVITVWDLDLINAIDPAFTLGVKKTKQKRRKVGDSEYGHADAVLDLSWTPLTRSKLASCSVDNTVIIWNLEKSIVEQRFTEHREKVQAIEWQPNNARYLLSGAFDGHICAFDTRSSSSSDHLKWKFKGEIERVAWNHDQNSFFAASTDTGSIFYCDIKKPGDPLYHFKAHETAIPSLSMSSPSLLYSGGSDGLIKVWKLKQKNVKLLQEKNMGMGMVHCLKNNPEVPHLLAVGGQKGGIKLWNTQSDKQIKPNIDDVVDEPKDINLNSITNAKMKAKKKKSPKFVNNQNIPPCKETVLNPPQKTKTEQTYHNTSNMAQKQKFDRNKNFKKFAKKSKFL